jgi:hypothetical protein
MTSVEVAIPGDPANRPMSTGQVWAPRVEVLVDGCLIYDPLRCCKAKAGGALLSQFLDLCDAADEKVLRYARRYGALGLGRRDESDIHRFLEPVTIWRGLAHQFRALLNIGAKLNQSTRPTRDDWMELDGTRYERGLVPKPWEFTGREGAYLARHELQILLRSLIDRFKVRPRIWWNHQINQWQIDLDSAGPSSNLPGLLTIQLMLTLADKDGFAVCSACHRSYIPKRRPNPERRNYCPNCGIRASWKDAARERRARLREERKGNAQKKTRKR